MAQLKSFLCNLAAVVVYIAIAAPIARAGNTFLDLPGAIESIGNRVTEPRSNYSSTIITDGRVIVAGGVARDGRVLNSVESFDPISGVVAPSGQLLTPRYGHEARLLSTGAILISGGTDASGRPVAFSELIDPRTGAVSVYTEVARIENEATFDAAPPAVVEVIPPHETRNVDLEEFVAVRFSRPAVGIDGDTITLYGPNGVVRTSVISAEGGMLAFLVPSHNLQPDSRYTVFVQGLTDQAGDSFSFAAWSFNTARITAPAASSSPTTERPGPPISNGDSRSTDPLASPIWRVADPSGDPEIWTPDAEALKDAGWKDKRALSKRTFPTLPEAASGVTALAGRVLRLNGEPLAGVTMKLGEVVATTDKDGAFLLQSVVSGSGVLDINGASASHDDSRYGRYQVRVGTSQGQTTNLGFTIWMPKIDPRGTVQIASPTTEEVVLRTPTIPDLEVHIPAGTIIRDVDGKVVTELNITAIPVNRPPFPLPDVGIPVYFSVQPGGAWLQGVDVRSSKGAQVYYPNYHKSLPGARAGFFSYDPNEREWYVYGEGETTADGRQVRPDAGVVIYQFTGAMFDGTGAAAPPAGPSPENTDTNCGCRDSERAGDPVSLSTGFFLYSERDLYLADVAPLDLTRHYRSQDVSQRAFGVGWTSIYDTILWSQQQYQEVDFILPDGGRVHFVRTSAGTSYSDAIFQSTAPGKWYNAVIYRNNARAGWDLILRDGSRWFFPQYQPVKEIVDPNGNMITITRRDTNGTAGPLTRVESSNGRYINFTLDASGRVTQATDNLGRSYTYTYDASGRLSTVTDPLQGVRTYTYDVSNRLATITNPRSIQQLAIQYDANGRVNTQTFADSNTYTYNFTVVNGKVTVAEATDQRGKVRRVEFNSAGYITKSIAAYGTADAQQAIFSLDTNGQILSITDALNRVTAYTYDGFGNRLTVTKLSGTVDQVTTTYTYASDGSHVQTVTDPLNHTTTYGYDSRGNVTSVTDALNHVTSFTRDAQGRTLTRTDPLNHTWTYAYAGPDLVSITDPLSRVTRIFPDEVGRAITAQDPLGNFTTYDYDKLDRLTKVTEPNGSTIQFGFDAASNTTNHLDQNNNTTTYTFNNLNLVASKTDALLHAGSFLYAANGKLSQVTDRKGQVSGISYDNLSRVSQIGFGATVANPTAYTSTIGYTYDSSNRATQIADSVGGTITRTYDGLDRLSQEQTAEGTVSYIYDAASRRSTMTVAGQSTVNYTWDNADRLTQIQQGTDVIAFVYDNAGRRTSTTLANGVVMTYGYDNANQLTSTTYTQGQTTLGDLTYTYDDSGRRIRVSGSFARVGLPAAISSAIYNANNQLTSWAGTTHTYDLNGNLTGNGTNTYVWNARNQLDSISGAVTASFIYDGLGRRKSKTIGSTQTGFLYDGLNFVQELTGATPKANLITGGVDELLQRKETTQTRYPIADALGSVIALTDSTGAIQTEYSFEPYGKPTASGAADTNSQSYTAREDDATGLLYYRARYLSPSLNRFVSEDPIGWQSGQTNEFAYVGGNPLSRTDPTGEIFFVPALIAIALAGGGDAAIIGGTAALIGGAAWWMSHNGNGGQSGNGSSGAGSASGSGSGSSAGGGSGSGAGDGTGSGSGATGKEECWRRYRIREQECNALYGGSTPGGSLSSSYSACMETAAAILKACLSSCGNGN